MPDFGINLGSCEGNISKNSKKINTNLNDLKLILSELVHRGLGSGKVWENRSFSILHDYHRDSVAKNNPIKKLAVEKTLRLVQQF